MREIVRQVEDIETGEAKLMGDTEPQSLSKEARMVMVTVVFFQSWK